ncbi:zinc finger and BTB domain-containing protein ttk isoform 1-T7 [Glossina fuscipes fuscipes]
MKMTPQRFCLRWNNHQSNMLSVFDQLLHEDQFTDVTLAVDGRYLTAHRMVLSACSPYFNALFINHPEKHPIVILKDVPYADMKALLDFMYRGEVSVDQERLTAFLRVAESLRIKGLTEVNDDKPSGGNTHNNEPTPQPPQLQRIQPYVVQQQQQRQKLSHQSANSVNSSNIAANSTPQPPFSQQQQSLLSSALASMPKRKRGRPRKLSGSSNGDYDEFEREGGLDSEMGDSKMCNDSYSGNDDGSDDNQRDPGHNDDLNESRDSVPPAKKSKPVKDTRNQQPHQQQQQQQQQQQDDSTSVQLIAPELSQRLFGSNKMITISNTTSSTTPATSPAAAVHTPAKHAMITLVSQQQQQQQQQQPQQSHLTTVKDLNEAKGHLTATALGLKVKTTLQTAMQAITTSTSSVAGNPNSLLKQQLRAGLRIDFNDAAATTNATLPNVQSSANVHETHEACSALQSLANVAERQAQNHIQPPTANNLHHQFLLHMAANPMLKQTGEYFQQQQQQTRLLLREEENNIDLLMDQSDKSDPEMLTLADENAGLDYSASTENVQRSDKNKSQESSNNNNTNNQDNGAMKSEKSKNNTRSKNSSGKPIQRRRIRRKAQSTIDDQAEQLTEMSVRGLDLFRYASINEGVYQCTECAKENMQKTFKNKYSFQRHAFLYHEGKHRKVFPCPLCGKEFSRPDKMKNHMKMTHESFVSKEIQSFNPLNYLITAAASGEIQATFPQLSRPPPSQASNNITATSGQKQSSDNSGTQLSVLIGNNNDLKEGKTLNSTQDSKKVAKDVMMMAETDNFKFPTDIEIKNEIIISPSPSPPPASLLPSVSMSLSSHSTLQQSTAVAFSFGDSLNLLKTSSTAPSAQAAQMQNAQRLEEVK